MTDDRHAPDTDAPGTDAPATDTLAAMGKAAVFTPADFDRLLEAGLPQAHRAGIRTREMGHGTVTLTMPASEDFLRPGGTVSGPAMFALADVALYGAVLSMAGHVVLAVTSNMTITFLRRPPARPLVAQARIVRMGRSLAYGEVTLYSEGEDDPVAHATGTYAIPRG
ncbi:PaaI family thioesterase [Nitrospirillum sp. BR 11828]|uniref:PaaI family thioesterase n=1 Tax=Nitrospirillum sp. BR 11828 TaxID=3104325 RepID=UPI002ACADEDB|nr:PaaI family thioesterase [Nitrospirillum sp. BR 11828]MDZ5647961.1 PaaI family thioesterase [Nitrospirillum sp. BR 11828]